jgi:hypothetical protein
MEALRHVLWIGGAPGSGKTTVATRLMRRHGLRWYGADTTTWAHRDRALQAGHGGAHRWEAMTTEERWVTATPEEMLELSLHAERGPMVVDDLRALPASPLVVAEGTTLPARAFSSGVADRTRAVWLLPTREFQRAQLAERGLPPGPTQLYLLLAETIAREAAEHDVPTLQVDGSLGPDETVAAVEQRFAEALAEGPCAKSRAARQALLREANESIAAQIRAYYARPWANGDPEATVRDLLCECGDLRCTASVELAIGALGAEPVFAPRHSSRA